jgi:hypothetical protein
MSIHISKMQQQLDSMEKMMQHLVLLHGGQNDPDGNDPHGSSALVDGLSINDGCNVRDDGVNIKIPSQLQTLKNISLRNAFSLWYLERVYLVPLSEENKKILEPLGRAVDAMKRFLSAGSVIPSWVPPEEAQYCLYKSIIHGLAEEGEAGLLDVCK